MESIDDFHKTVEGFNASASALLPWARIGKIDNSVKYFRVSIVHVYTRFKKRAYTHPEGCLTTSPQIQG